MKNQASICNVIKKSHGKSVIRAFLVGSKEFANIFSKVPIGDIEDSTCHIVVLQAMLCNNYVIVEYVEESDYPTWRYYSND